MIGSNSDTCVTYYRLHGEHPGAIALEYNPFGGASRIGERHSALGKAPSACPNLPTRIFESPHGPENVLGQNLQHQGAQPTELVSSPPRDFACAHNPIRRRPMMFCAARTVMRSSSPRYRRLCAVGEWPLVPLEPCHLIEIPQPHLSVTLVLRGYFSPLISFSIIFQLRPNPKC